MQFLFGEEFVIRFGQGIAVAFAFERIREETQHGLALPVGHAVDPVGRVEGDPVRNSEIPVDPFHRVIGPEHFRDAEIVVAIIHGVADPERTRCDQRQNARFFGQGQAVRQQFADTVHAVDV